MKTAATQSTIAAFVCLTLLSTSVLAQSEETKPSDAKSTAAQPTFQLADAHPSPHSNQPFMRGGYLRGDQFIIRQATMVDLIADAYAVDTDNVLSGPSWLDADRFDIIAKAPRTTSPDDIRLMLEALLKERFHLVAHPDTHPIPSYVLRIDTAKGGSKLRDPADPSKSPGCDETHTPTNPDGLLGHFITKCHNQPMEQIRAYLQGLGRQYVLDKPVVDATGLKGTYDYDIEFTFQPAPGGLSIFDAADKELGLKFALENYPTPVIVVDSVNQKPTANALGLDKALAPPPPAEFEVAVIKPAKADEQLGLDVRGSQITITGLPLNFVIPWAWSLNPNNSKDNIINAPKWLGDDHWDILGKMALDPQAKAVPELDFDSLQEMMRTLLQERFGLKSHMEDRPTDAYTLVAVSPKMKKGDPMMRSGCKEGPGPDGKDPRIANPILGRLLTCTNINMAEFGEQLQIQASGYIFYPVLDATGLTGGYDFTLSFSTAGQLQSAPKPPPSNDPNAASTSEPSGGLSLFDAVSRQLGLKMEKGKRPEPVIVIDHIDEKPTDN